MLSSLEQKGATLDQGKGNLIPVHYDGFLQELKDRIRAAQVRAALSENQELVALYCSIGLTFWLVKRMNEGWGARIIDCQAEVWGHQPPSGLSIQIKIAAIESVFIGSAVRSLPLGDKSHIET